MKRERTLADAFVAGSPKNTQNLVVNSVMESVRNRVRFGARRFVFDETATARAATILRDIPELIIEQARFARPPFDTTWIEIDHRALIRVIQPQYVMTEDSDKNLGFLVDQGSVYVIVTDSKTTGLGPFRYDLNVDWPLQEQIKFAESVGTSRGQLDEFFLGATINDLRLKEDLLRVLRSHNRVSLLPLTRKDLSRDELNTILTASYGDLRILIAFLLILNQPGATTYREVPRSSGFVHGKVRPYLEHVTVSVVLDSTKILARSAGPATGDLRRRHEVRGHYCHDLRARQGRCDHRWASDERDDVPDPDRWKCVTCGGKRWWRRDHHRGSATMGFNLHEYQVTSPT